MTAWSDREARFLEEHWQQGDGTLTLAVACPHCLHAGAFEDLVVYDVAPRGGGGGDRGGHADNGPLADGDGGEVLAAFPSEVTVVCQCGQPAHAPADGCGRAGNIETGLG